MAPREIWFGGLKGGRRCQHLKTPVGFTRTWGGPSYRGVLDRRRYGVDRASVEVSDRRGHGLGPATV